jgi:hypothetical protein
MTETTTISEPPPPLNPLLGALATLNHPANLDLQARLAALENMVRIMAAQMLQEKSDV